MTHNTNNDIVERLRAKINPQYVDTLGCESHLYKECSDEIERLRQTVEDQKRLYANCIELAKDAERYRWLRNQDWEIKHRTPLVIRFDQFDNDDDPCMNLDVLDAAIDTAMKGEK